MHVPKQASQASFDPDVLTMLFLLLPSVMLHLISDNPTTDHAFVNVSAVDMIHESYTYCRPGSGQGFMSSVVSVVWEVHDVS